MGDVGAGDGRSSDSLSSAGARGGSGRDASAAPTPPAEAPSEDLPSPGASRPPAELPSPGASRPPAELPVPALSRAFGKGRPALIAYLMAGYPDRAASLDALRALTRAGADVIELGVPYGDPLADGPVIAEAARSAREQPGGFGLAESIELAGEFARDAGEIAPPVVIMTYLNPLMRLGLARAAQAMRDAGVAGVIVPDMPPEAARPWLAVASGLDTVFLVAPTSTPERIATIAAASAGFVYCVSSRGVTGERAGLSNEVATLVAGIREHTSLPVCVGFGVGTPEQTAAVAAFADGVIVGSAIVRRQDDAEALETFVRDLARAVGA